MRKLKIKKGCPSEAFCFWDSLFCKFFIFFQKFVQKLPIKRNNIGKMKNRHFRMLNPRLDSTTVKQNEPAS